MPLLLLLWGTWGCLMLKRVELPLFEELANVLNPGVGFVGLNGMQRFYLGRVWTGMLQLVTLGGLGLWQLADAVLLALEVLRDGAGKRVLLTRHR